MQVVLEGQVQQVAGDALQTPQVLAGTAAGAYKYQVPLKGQVRQVAGDALHTPRGGRHTLGKRHFQTVNCTMKVEEVASATPSCWAGVSLGVSPQRRVPPLGQRAALLPGNKPALLISARLVSTTHKPRFQGKRLQ